MMHAGDASGKTISLGQIAYENYWPALGTPPPVAWARLSPAVRVAWEAAAQAVLALKQEKEEERQLCDGPISSE